MQSHALARGGWVGVLSLQEIDVLPHCCFEVTREAGPVAIDQQSQDNLAGSRRSHTCLGNIGGQARAAHYGIYLADHLSASIPSEARLVCGKGQVVCISRIGQAIAVGYLSHRLVEVSDGQFASIGLVGAPCGRWPIHDSAYAMMVGRFQLCDHQRSVVRSRVRPPRRVHRRRWKLRAVLSLRRDKPSGGSLLAVC
jgi:hypothetical protein